MPCLRKTAAVRLRVASRKRAAVKASKGNRFVTSGVLRQAARIMLPFYQRIAADRTYSEQWAKAVREGNLDHMLRLLKKTVRGADQYGLSTNGIGYFVDIPVSRPIMQYTNGTSIPPGTTQFKFSPTVHRRIARSVIPLYKEIIGNRSFRIKVTAAIRGSRTQALEALVRSKVQTGGLKSVRIAFSGFSMGFRYSDSKYLYENEFFREIP